MSTMFITITGQTHYLGMKPFKVGRIVKISKEPDNAHDSDAILVELPFIDTIGYVANSTHTVYQGTYSASRLYDKIEDYAYAQIMFITHSGAIAMVLSPEEVEKENPTEGYSVADKSGKEENSMASKPLSKIGF